MKVIEHLQRAKKPLISFEIIPPRRGGKIKNLLSLVEELSAYDPPFIDITSHPAVMTYEETPDGIRKRVKRKRPGTIGLSALIQNKYNIDCVPHVLCNGFTREETEDFLIELHYLGIDNVLAIRGDEIGFDKKIDPIRSTNTYAVELIEQIQSMNNGQYVDEKAEPTNFCIGAAGYPEKHFEAPNLDTDIRRTKDKIDKGASYIVSQMFFNNEDYFSYVKRCREAGIKVPIIPGLKIVTRKRHLSLIPSRFYCDIPKDLSAAVEAAKDEQVVDIGVEWALKQAQDLIDKGVPSVHFYIMQNAAAINRVMAKLKL